MNRFEKGGLAFISDEQDRLMDGTRVQSGDVLLNITGASIGRVCVVPDAILPANVNQHVCIIRTDNTIDPEFLSFFISTPDFQRFILDTQAGATRQALTKTLIEDFEIPLPSVSEQKRIAIGLREQMATLQRSRAAAEAQLEAARKMAASYLRTAFGSPEAQTWPRKSLAAIGELFPSKSISTEGDAEVLAITTACLSETGFQDNGVKTARMWSFDVPDCTVGAGEVLIARSNTRDLVGRAALFRGKPQRAVASDLTIRYWTHAPHSPSYIAAYLSFLYLTGYWKEKAGGASGSMKKITRPQVLNLEILVPDPKRQEDIAMNLGRELLTAQGLRRSIEDQIALIDKMQPALLRRAFNGEL